MAKKAPKVDGDQFKIKIVTPPGEARWASLKTPKSWNGEDAGKYQISVILEADKAEAIINDCIGLGEKVADVMGDNPSRSPYDPYKTLEEDGRIELRFKKKYFPANDKYPATAPITTLLPDGTKLKWEETDWAVGNGSMVQVGGYIVPYYTPMLGLGISLRLMAVNVITLEKYTGSGSADDFTFAAPDDTNTEMEAETSDF